MDTVTQSLTNTPTNDNLGVIAVEYDRKAEQFRYNSDIGNKLAGTYNDRSLWHIMLADGVAKEEDVAVMRACFARACAGEDVDKQKYTVTLCTARGTGRSFLMRFACGDSAGGKDHLLFILFIDVTEDVAASSQMLERTLTDHVTGLLLRRAFLARTEEVVRAEAPGTYAMVYFDVDKFSVINERYGYDRGDELLRVIGDMVRRVCSGGSIGCRVAADCFTVCIRNEQQQIERLVRDYQTVLRELGLPFEISMSFGICVISDPKLSPEIILDHAALAQRSIKGSYVTRYAYYDDALRRVRFMRQEIESQMSAALEQGQFDVYLQPQYELSTGRLIGGEVLARWFHPERGVIMPGEFIPIFEQNGFISKLDCFVWEKACQLLRRWTDSDSNGAPSLSINISRVDLHNMDVVKTLCALTGKYGVPPRLLRLEITESAYADHPQQLVELVDALQRKGFVVEMDDFGSGYSSLNTLKDVPINALKLDLRFLSGDTISGRGGSIVNSIIRMARWLELPVCAEGVETQQQAEFLLSVGCDYAQGYLYARPMPVPDFERLKSETARGRYDDQKQYADLADANAFWNPDSQETLIFNSYVGGAAILEYDGAGVEILRANKKFIAMLHLDNINQYERVLHSRMTREERDRFFHTLDDALAAGEERACTIRLQENGKDGETELWVRTRARVLSRSGNSPLFYIAIDDVTAEHEAQQRFRVSQNTLIAAAAHTHLQYWTYDMVRHLSIQGIESTEYDCGVPDYLENYPQSLIDLGYVHPDHADAYLQLHRDLQAGARTVSLDALTGGEGRWEWRKIRYTAIVDEDGAVRSAIGTSESLSAYKELEQRFMIAIQQCGLLSWTMNIKERNVTVDVPDRKGGMKRLILADMPDSFIAGGCVHPDDAGIFRGAYARMYAGESETNITVRCRMPDKTHLPAGEWPWQKLNFTALTDKDGKTGIVVCTGTDVTEQVNMQTRYREALTYYENLNPDEYVSILHANITRGTVDTREGGAVPYLSSVRLLTARIGDDEERARLALALQPNSLFREYGKGASRFVYEYRLRLQDGTERWVRTTVRLLMDTSKQELCAFIYTMDINDEKMKSLVFRHIVLEDYDFVTIIDTEHDRFVTFITDRSDEFVPSAEQYSFTDAAEIFALTTAPEEDAHIYIRETRIPYILHRLTSEGSYSFLYRSRQPDGSLRRKRMSLRLIDERTKHVCMTRLDIESLGMRDD